METLFHSFLTDDELLRISRAIKEKEKITAGEIVISVKEKLPLFGRKPVQEMAAAEFSRLGINNTRDRTGILLYILLESREFAVLADEGINSKVSEGTWHGVKDRLQERFQVGDFCGGLVNAVEEVGNILSGHFPIKPDDTNEIPNRVIVRP